MLRNSQKKLLGLINEFSNTVGYKINKQKSIAFLYTSCILLEVELKKLCHKILGDKNLTKYVQDLCIEN